MQEIRLVPIAHLRHVIRKMFNDPRRARVDVAGAARNTDALPGNRIPERTARGNAKEARATLLPIEPRVPVIQRRSLLQNVDSRPVRSPLPPVSTV